MLVGLRAAVAKHLRSSYAARCNDSQAVTRIGSCRILSTCSLPGYQAGPSSNESSSQEYEDV